MFFVYAFEFVVICTPHPPPGREGYSQNANRPTPSQRRFDLTACCLTHITPSHYSRFRRRSLEILSHMSRKLNTREHIIRGYTKQSNRNSAASTKIQIPLRNLTFSVSFLSFASCVETLRIVAFRFIPLACTSHHPQYPEMRQGVICYSPRKVGHWNSVNHHRSGRFPPGGWFSGHFWLRKESVLKAD